MTSTSTPSTMPTMVNAPIELEIRALREDDIDGRLARPFAQPFRRGRVPAQHGQERDRDGGADDEADEAPAESAVPREPNQVDEALPGSPTAIETAVKRANQRTHVALADSSCSAASENTSVPGPEPPSRSLVRGGSNGLVLTPADLSWNPERVPHLPR